ncbi:uncharacterized protein LOC129255534 isoform X1 [Lytechinus pictus]|uniref:uncharacterized protein LOC129255534 isoform X1 n=1 Tax=Lytechinus pictus TaxID=7653 RepID=UPI0030B9BB3F
MPITKIPIIHKFGIISQSQRDELQERLLQQSVYQVSKTSHIPQTTRNPLELTESFIQQFNNTSNLEEKDKNEDIALKLLTRIKRRAGLKDGGRGSHVDIPRAWSELSMLAQCRGKVQEECLDALIVSLRQAEFSVDHIPSLFYLAETTLYWLRTDAMDQPFLRIGEIKLLKMGQAVFLRLFYHHMAGHLQGRSEFKSRLLTYLSAITQGFAENEEAYSPYPGAHLCLRLIASIGKMIVGEVMMDELKKHPEELRRDLSDVQEHPKDDLPETEVKKAYAPSSPPNSITHPDVPRSTPVRHSQKNPPLPQPISQPNTRPNTNHRSRPNTQPTPAPQQAPHRPDTYTSSIHDLSPSLWHALDVWRCTVHLSSGFPEAVKALSLCGTTLGSEHWVDAVCALFIISEAAKGNMKVMKTLQNLAKGMVSGASAPRDPTPHRTPGSRASQTERFDDLGDDIDLGGLGDSEGSEDGSNISSKGSFSDNQSVEIRLTEMLDSKMELRSDSKSKKFSLDSDMSLGMKQPSNLSSNSLLKSTSLRNTSVAVNIDSPQDKRAASLSDRSTALKGSGSSIVSVPDISSRESQLDSAGALLGNHAYSQSPVMEEDEDVDSDLMPGDESEVEIRRVDVTKPFDGTTSPVLQNYVSGGLRMRREVSFDIDIIGEESVDAEKTIHGQKKGLHQQQMKSEKFPGIGASKVSKQTGEKYQGKVTPLTRRLQANMISDLDGINGWPWEVAFAYTDLMSHLCLHGNTSNIQKRALVGDRKPDYRSAPTVTSQKLNGLESAGLLDMAEYENPPEDDLGLTEDWSWRVRYAAILALVKLSRCLEGDTNREGLRTTAWNFLMIRHSKERDDRVMEAFRVGQVDAHLEKEMQKCPSKHSLNGRLAAGLASTYLPPLAPVVQQPKKPQLKKVELPKPMEPIRKGPNRLSLRQELQVATALQDQQPQVGLYSRTNMDLKRIVEDQWRKELQEHLEDEEKEKREYLEEQQANLEIREREVAEIRSSKFLSPTTPPL